MGNLHHKPATELKQWKIIYRLHVTKATRAMKREWKLADILEATVFFSLENLIFLLLFYSQIRLFNQWFLFSDVLEIFFRQVLLYCAKGLFLAGLPVHILKALLPSSIHYMFNTCRYLGSLLKNRNSIQQTKYPDKI